MGAILFSYWLDVIVLKLLAFTKANELTDIRKPEKMSMVEGYPVGFI